eukprot:CAMPEP_0197453948 /NCGR_PEP_ID=MMETSP1175-20131217/36494_1 /TAXON_ID=1003142 /ORGANISM="Triceratium dubium, Strain CCMP147" /LENGTH=199 /DNA_ID=CAMNT_0042987385 /DNA_START=110 /DNA_END=709 /DNA_ORIENTATION=-
MKLEKISCRRRLANGLHLLAVVITFCENAQGFSTNAVSSFVAPQRLPTPFVRRLEQTSDFEFWRIVQTPLRMATEINSSEGVQTVEDSNGNEFSEGVVVRVLTSEKAYQVPAKGWGTFDLDNKDFIPAPGDVSERESRCLVVPVGLRGVVTKVIRLNNLSASLPVQVKFMPGKYNEEGYDAPVAFLMHFRSSELEVVVD